MPSMTTSQSSLDPRKSPWKRGDLCALGFKKSGLVLNHTAEYLEVRWLAGEGIERIATADVDNVLRVAHADSLGPDGQTYLQTLEAIEVATRLKADLSERMRTVKSKKERRDLDRLTRRVFAEDKCEWDAKNKIQLLNLLLRPETVGITFKLRERLHRAFCKRHEQ